MAQLYAAQYAAEQWDKFQEENPLTPAWVREDNIAVYDLNTPDRLVRQNYSIVENKLATPVARRHILGLVGGNEVSRMAGNPQDIESDLRNLTRPLTKCPEREYQPMRMGQEQLVINNRKTHLALDLRPVHLPDYQMWAYPVTFGPQPLKKETCGRPEKY